MNQLLASCIFQSKALGQGESEEVLQPDYGLLSRMLKAPRATTAVASLGDRGRRQSILGRMAVLCHQEVAIGTPCCVAKTPA